MSLDINSLSKNPSLDSRIIYQIELALIALGLLVILIMAALQIKQLLLVSTTPTSANVQQVQIENAVKVILPASN